MLSVLIGFIATVSVIILIRPLAIRLGLTDEPGGRKKHHGDVPLIGGISMYCGFMLAIMTLHFSLGNYRALFVSSMILIFIGILDDFRELSARARLIAQFIVCLIISIWGNVKLQTLGSLFFSGNINLAWFALPFTWFGTISLINSVNMMDGLDGLAGGISLLSFSALALLCAHHADIMNLSILLILISCLVAFLLFNWRLPFGKPATIFMGDAGSLFLGIMLAWFAISLTQGPHAVAHPVTMLWLIALPLMDLLAVFIRRIMRHRSPMQAGSEHLHYLLQKKGLSNLSIVLIMWAISLLFISFGLLGEWFQLSQSGLFVSFLISFLGYFVMTQNL